MDVTLITMEPKRINKISDKKQEQEYLRKMNSIPAVFKKYSKEQQEQVRQKVTQLPSDQLVVIYLTFWEDLCEYEIAKSICSTASKVLKIKSAALLNLREMIEGDKNHKELCIA